MPASDYLYRAQAVLSNGDTSPWSTDAPSVLGRTRALSKTFPALTQIPWEDSSGWKRFSLVQRIEAARLSTSGAWVRLTLRGSPIDNNYARLKTISISRAAYPAMGVDLYDSAEKPVLIASDVFLAPNQILPIPAVGLPAINYNLDHAQHLLIAIDFDEVTDSSIAALPVPQDWLETVVGYYTSTDPPAPPPDAAMLTDRLPGWTPSAYLYLIEEIEVG